jgi:hypothetical protein
VRTVETPDQEEVQPSADQWWATMIVSVLGVTALAVIIAVAAARGLLERLRPKFTRRPR